MRSQQRSHAGLDASSPAEPPALRMAIPAGLVVATVIGIGKCSSPAQMHGKQPIEPDATAKMLS